jgi:hypothetical protein
VALTAAAFALKSIGFDTLKRNLAAVFAVSEMVGLFKLGRFRDLGTDYCSRKFGPATCFHLQGMGSPR